MVTAKQNQKFPFNFLSAPPTPPAEEKKKGKEHFWFLLPRPKGADEARIIGLFAQRKFAQRLLFHRIKRATPYGVALLMRYTCLFPILAPPKFLGPPPHQI